MEAKSSQRKSQPFFEFLYSMGKCGSSSIFRAMCHTRDPVEIIRAHTHDVNMLDGFRRSHKPSAFQLSKTNDIALITETKPPTKLITLVRNPVERAISGLHAHRVGWIKKFHKDPREILLDGYNKDWALEWFDNYLFPMGIDVYSKPFDFKAKCITLEVGDIEVLVLRLEDIKKWQPIVEKFLGRKIGGIGHRNTGGIPVRQFRMGLKLPDSFLDYMLNSKVAKHFYSPVERHQFRTKYQKS